MTKNIINFFFGDKQNQNADSECESLASLEPLPTELQGDVQDIVTRAYLQIDDNQEPIFNSVVSDYVNRLAVKQGLSGASSIMNTLSANPMTQSDRAKLDTIKEFWWDLAEQKSGRRESDYQRLLFADPRGYCLHEWRVLYCLKHVFELRPGWSYVHAHYPDLLVNDVLMVLPKETMRHFLASLSRCTDFVQNDETRVRPFSLFRQVGESAHVHTIETLNDWLTLSMYHSLALAVNSGAIAPKASEDLEPINVMSALD